MKYRKWCADCCVEFLTPTCDGAHDCHGFQHTQRVTEPPTTSDMALAALQEAALERSRNRYEKMVQVRTYQELLREKYADRPNCMTCGKPGEIRAAMHDALVCKDCRIKELEGIVSKRNGQVMDIAVALKVAKPYTCPPIDEVMTKCIARAEEETADVPASMTVDEWETAVSGVNSVMRGKKADTIVIDDPLCESGPGLASRFRDTTPAAKLSQEPVTCDVGSDWED